MRREALEHVELHGRRRVRVVRVRLAVQLELADELRGDLHLCVHGGVHDLTLARACVSACVWERSLWWVELDTRFR